MRSGSAALGGRWAATAAPPTESTAVEPEHYSRVLVGLLQGLLLQLGVFGDEIDIDGYLRASTALLDRPPAKQGRRRAVANPVAR